MIWYPLQNYKMVSCTNITASVIRCDSPIYIEAVKDYVIVAMNSTAKVPGDTVSVVALLGAPI